MFQTTNQVNYWILRMPHFWIQIVYTLGTASSRCIPISCCVYLSYCCVCLRRTCGLLGQSEDAFLQESWREILSVHPFKTWRWCRVLTCVRCFHSLLVSPWLVPLSSCNVNLSPIGTFWWMFGDNTVIPWLLDARLCPWEPAQIPEVPHQLPTYHVGLLYPMVRLTWQIEMIHQVQI